MHAVPQSHLLLDASIWPEVAEGATPPSAQDLVTLARTAEEAGLFSLSAPVGAGHVDHAECGIALAWIAAQTSRIGLISGVNMAAEHPYFAARRLAALDRISGGRAGFVLDGAALRGTRGREYLLLMRELWDGWADDAVVADKDAGVLIAAGHVRHTNHVGPHFRVRGPLPLSRTPQGHPVLTVEAARAAEAEGADLLLACGDAETLFGLRKAVPSGCLLARIGLDDPGDPLIGDLGHDDTAIAETLEALFRDGILQGVSMRWRGVSALRRFVDHIAPRLLSGRPRPAEGSLRDRLGLSRPSVTAADFAGAELFQGLSA